MPNEASKQDFHEKVTENFLAQIEGGHAVWQIPHEQPIHMPVNPMTKRYFQNSNAMIFLQQQAELGTNDPRWVQQSKVQQIGGWIQKDSKATVIETRTKEGKTGYTHYFNFSQLNFKQSVGTAEIYDAKMDACAEKMLEQAAILTPEKLRENKDAFFSLSREIFQQAYTAAHENVEVEAKMAARLQDIQNAILTNTPKTAKQAFLNECKKALLAHPDSKGYVIEATKALLLQGKHSEARIKELISTYAPVAALDSVRGGKYSDYVFSGIEKDNRFQKQYQDTKKQHAMAY